MFHHGVSTITKYMYDLVILQVFIHIFYTYYRYIVVYIG